MHENGGASASGPGECFSGPERREITRLGRRRPIGNFPYFSYFSSLPFAPDVSKLRFRREPGRYLKRERERERESLTPRRGDVIYGSQERKTIEALSLVCNPRVSQRNIVHEGFLISPIPSNVN